MRRRHSLTRCRLQSCQKLAEPFERWLHQQPREGEEETGRVWPVCIISDMFMLWTLDTGEKYGIPRVLFNTFGAFATSLIDSASASISQNALQKEGDSVVLSMNLPSPLRFNKKEIATGFFEYDRSNTRLQFVIQCFQSLSRGWGMLINTFEDLEAPHLGHLRSLTGKPIWSIGPLLPPSFAGKTGRGKTADISEDKLIRWLDSQRSRSVVYVSFGSQTFLSESQTHCGWNSTLESITLGVPMIAWPMFWDQHFNSKQVAEQFGTGVQFCEHRDGIPDEERVKEVVRLVLTEDEGEEMRRRAEKLKEMASKAVADDGSSKANLRTFVCEMQKLIKSPNTKNEIGYTESMPTVP